MAFAASCVSSLAVFQHSHKKRSEFLLFAGPRRDCAKCYPRAALGAGPRLASSANTSRIASSCLLSLGAVFLCGPGSRLLGDRAISHPVSRTDLPLQLTSCPTLRVYFLRSLRRSSRLQSVGVSPLCGSPADTSVSASHEGGPRFFRCRRRNLSADRVVLLRVAVSLVLPHRSLAFPSAASASAVYLSWFQSQNPSQCFSIFSLDVQQIGYRSSWPRVLSRTGIPAFSLLPGVVSRRSSLLRHHGRSS